LNKARTAGALSSYLVRLVRFKRGCWYLWLAVLAISSQLVRKYSKILIQSELLATALVPSGTLRERYRLKKYTCCLTA